MLCYFPDQSLLPLVGPYIPTDSGIVCDPFYVNDWLLFCHLSMS